MESVDTLFSLVLLFGVIFGVAIPLVCIILTIIGMWKTISKTGEEGWKSLVPVYNAYTLCKKIGVYEWWPLIAVGLVVVNILPVIGSIAFVAGSIYYTILFNVSLAKSFGKPPEFAVGLILLPPVFYLILGSKKSNYQGPDPMEDIVLNFVKENMNGKGSSTTTSNTTQQTINNCPNCGAPSTGDSVFCASCGTRLK